MTPVFVTAMICRVLSFKNVSSILGRGGGQDNRKVRKRREVDEDLKLKSGTEILA